MVVQLAICSSSTWQWPFLSVINCVIVVNFLVYNVKTSMFTGVSSDVPFLRPLNDLSLIVFVNLEKKRKK